MLCERHSALRTTFSVEEGKPVQVVHDKQEIDFEQIDASGWDDETLKKRITDAYERPFDLENGPLLRVRLFACAENEQLSMPARFILLLTFHHIICDAHSIWVLLGELLTGSKNFARSASPKATEVVTTKRTRTYADYVAWQSEMLAGEKGQQLWAYW